jgi:hypothetical protein
MRATPLELIRSTVMRVSLVGVDHTRKGKEYKDLQDGEAATSQSLPNERVRTSHARKAMPIRNMAVFH